MLFKHKYKRSAWYAGLLEAERNAQLGYELTITTHGIEWIHDGSGILLKHIQHKPWKERLGFEQGVLDYKNHMERLND